VGSGFSIAHDDLKSTVAAAQYVDLSPSTLAKLRCAGGGPEYVKFGRAVRYEQAALDRWVASHRAKNTSDAERLPQRLVRGRTVARMAITSPPTPLPLKVARVAASKASDGANGESDVEIGPGLPLLPSAKSVRTGLTKKSLRRGPGHRPKTKPPVR